MKYITIKNIVKNGIAEMYIEGDITDTKWWDDDITPNDIKDKLEDLKDVKTLNLYVNSNGGSCKAGNTIFNILDRYKAKNQCKIDVYIDYAASMASGISMVGDNIYMADNAIFMLHKPLCEAWGNANDFEHVVEMLNKTEDTLVSNYMRRFNGTEDELRDLLNKESYLTAKEAKEYGFVDVITNGAEMVACDKGIKIKNQLFSNSVEKLIKNKYPEINIKKEEKELVYDSKLGEFGIDEELFKTLNVESEKLLSIANTVKEKNKPEPISEFISEDKAKEFLNVENISADEVLDYAKKGLNPVDVSEIKNKAIRFDKIMESKRQEVLKNALKAEGEFYNEDVIKKMISVLDYDELETQNQKWIAQAKEALNAGKRQSAATSTYRDKNNETYVSYKELI